MLRKTQLLLLGVLIVAVGYSVGYQWRAPGAPLVQVDPWGVDSLRVRISNANQIVAVPPVQVTPDVEQSLSYATPLVSPQALLPDPPSSPVGAVHEQSYALQLLSPT